MKNNQCLDDKEYIEVDILFIIAQKWLNINLTFCEEFNKIIFVIAYNEYHFIYFKQYAYVFFVNIILFLLK